MMENSKLLNIASSTVLSCTALLHLIRFVVAYARTFDESCTVPFREASVADIRWYLQPLKYITTELSSYERYSCIECFCIGYGNIIVLLEKLNKMEWSMEIKTSG